jgi:hypothetical protein
LWAERTASWRSSVLRLVTVQKPLAQLVDKLRGAYGESLVAVVLYGSAVSEERHSKFSDFNVLCVLAAVTPRELSAGEEVFHWWRGLGNPSPLLLTEPEMSSSAESFPIEFLDIQQQHRLLHGKDVISGLAIGRSFYRAQVEHDLRAKVLRLRQKAAGILSDPGLLRRLLADSVSTFCVLLRHALALHGVEVTARKREIVERAAEHFALDSRPFLQLLDLREERCAPRDVDPWSLLAPYLDALGKAIDAVARLPK